MDDGDPGTERDSGAGPDRDTGPETGPAATAMARIDPEDVPERVAADGPEAVEIWQRVVRLWRSAITPADAALLATYARARAMQDGLDRAIRDPTGGQYAHLAPGLRIRAWARCSTLTERVELAYTGRCARQAERLARMLGSASGASPSAGPRVH